MLLRGNRGERDGKNMLIVVIENIEARDLYSSGPGQFSEEGQKFIASHPEFVQMIEKWRKLATAPGEDTVYTDYAVVIS
jgi:hypothetical protein